MHYDLLSGNAVALVHCHRQDAFQNDPNTNFNPYESKSRSVGLARLALRYIQSITRLVVLDLAELRKLNFMILNIHLDSR